MTGSAVPGVSGRLDQARPGGPPLRELGSQRDAARALRQNGHSYVEIATVLRRQFALNGRAAFRTAHGWSQREAAEAWTRRWPDEPKSAKNISYWEQWPAPTGHAPSLDVIERLAELYQCRVADLLADRGDYRALDPRAAGPAARAEAAMVSRREAPAGWYIKSLVTVLQLGGDSADALEERTIVATRDSLAEIATTMSIPRHPADGRPRHDAEITVLSGGRMEVREQPHESQFRQVIALAQPLATGEAHQYRLAIRLPPGQPMINHAVHVPLQRSDHYSLTIRFPADSPPSGVWLLDGVPPAVLRDREFRGKRLAPDRFGEICADFRGLVQGQAYGLRWG